MYHLFPSTLHWEVIDRNLPPFWKMMDNEFFTFEGQLKEYSFFGHKGCVQSFSLGPKGYARVFYEHMRAYPEIQDLLDNAYRCAERWKKNGS